MTNNPYSKTKTFTVRTTQEKFKKIENDWKTGNFPSRAAWMEKAIDHFLGEC